MAEASSVVPLVVTPEYGLVVLVGVAMFLLQQIVLVLPVVKQRISTGIKAPTLYPRDGQIKELKLAPYQVENYMRAQRAHQNNVEFTSVFMALFLVTGAWVVLFRLLGGVGYLFGVRQIGSLFHLGELYILYLAATQAYALATPALPGLLAACSSAVAAMREAAPKDLDEVKAGAAFAEGWEKLFQLAGSEPVSYAKDAIMQDGEAHEFVYRLQQGSVRVEKGDPRFSASRTAVVNILSPGVTFGEMSFLDGTANTATPQPQRSHNTQTRHKPQTSSSRAYPAARPTAPLRTSAPGAPACATCVADSDDVSVVRLSRAALEGVLEAEANLGRDFFCQMAIEVTHRLQKVSTAIAETGEAPRGLTQPADAALPISAKKLLKVRHRLGVPDTETMAFMCAATMVNPSKRRLHGTMYVFETLVGFVHKMFGIKQQESVSYRHVSEVLRETFTLKREDGGIELVLSVPNRSYLFYPAAVDDAFDAIHRCRDQFVAKQSRQAPAPVPSPRFEQDPHSEASQALVEESSAVFLKESTSVSSGSSRSERSTPRAALRADSFGGLALAKVVGTATLERYRPGDVIIAEGSQPATLFNLARGRVSSAKILTLYEGAMFGEMSFLSGGKACATVVAEVESEVWQIRAPAVESSLASLPLNEQAPLAASGWAA
ncbi:hypothetical protein EMIHUDRAFT_452928 [Emiliania huxleyi CCMP1516]|uniref:Cyclic nucleotide-binding domain-containing protein n=2 Tax=Emiliania huxleyi TaxID=2903 RepID=A0A0D3ICK1_EMIH1|nr:hypothetical protein EMIHUDRAFT_452928 [Emiliania huxleyi CCMP1516]EOD08986.1 hypothetical protein EMIHUDRAFT_452928 [Emiliania huxleyi CCMP1516]|eukprot:XP_005761415.1 hypothetical protein EMIHUDRAFT_452928 [Emiliania huxleyi CCMP1516]